LLITDEYRRLNKQFHEMREDYGANGAKWITSLFTIQSTYKPESYLDYGCGKGSLATIMWNAIGAEVAEYDPAIPGKDKLPEPADMVICTDVLEHIEPDCLEDVLNHIQSLAKKAVFLVISLKAAGKTLPDGRNAHLIVENSNWWLNHLLKRWDCHAAKIRRGNFIFIGVPK
jgi:2-polyprenyl-3-methyl-5-hydroxy-6-metoxy-1,4-benzoquinol methylase